MEYSAVLRDFVMYDNSLGTIYSISCIDFYPWWGQPFLHDFSFIMMYSSIDMTYIWYSNNKWFNSIKRNFIFLIIITELYFTKTVLISRILHIYSSDIDKMQHWPSINWLKNKQTYNILQKFIIVIGAKITILSIIYHSWYIILFILNGKKYIHN